MHAYCSVRSRLRVRRNLLLTAEVCLLLSMEFVCPRGIRANHTQGRIYSNTGLALSLEPLQGPTPMPSFVATITNGSDAGVALQLGEILGDGQNVSISALTFTVQDTHGQRVRWSRISGGVVPGRIIPYVLLLPPHSRLSFRVSLSDYDSQTGRSSLAPGRYLVTGEITCPVLNASTLTPDARFLASLHYCPGEVRSRPVTVVVR